MPTSQPSVVVAGSLAPAHTQAAPDAGKPIPRRQRSMLIDVVRGIAISLVAFGHTNEGLLHRAWWGLSDVGHRINNGIYSFHMPAFFFVSGIFLPPGVQKRGFGRYFNDRLRTILYPYLLWDLLLTPILHKLAAAHILHDFDYDHLLINTLTGAEAWFLPTLFLSLMVCALLVGPRNRVIQTFPAAARFLMPAVFLVALLAELFMPLTTIPEVDLMFRHLPFLILGMWVGQSFEQLTRLPRWLCAILGAGLLAVIVWMSAVNHVGQRPWVVPLGILGTVMLLLLANALGHGLVARAFAWAGEASLAIYLISPYLQGTGRELLLKGLHTRTPWPQLIVPSLLAIVVPAWLHQHRERQRIGWLFVWPIPRKTA